jgi:sterol desaturase/sphingolipid hydroxylase (fatty acid hydroxylase superfamily)
MNIELPESLNFDSEDLVYFIDPLGFPLWFLPVLTAIKYLSEEFVGWMIVVILKFFKQPQMPSRVPKPIAKYLEVLEFKDYVYLVMNQTIEVIFLSHFAHLILYKLPKDLESLTFTNTIVAFYAIFFVEDFFYYWMHRFLHLPAIYPYVHKHHHRQTLPFRGYLDAANESPIEQVGGLGCIWITLKLLDPYLHLHAFTVFAWISAFATFALLNHTPYDVQLGFWGLGYQVRAHETHHRKLFGNYSQNTMFWDRLFGTYLEYPQRKNVEE